MYLVVDIMKYRGIINVDDIFIWGGQINMYMIPEQEIMRLIDMYPCQYDKEDLVAAACKATNQKGKDIYVVVDNRTGDCWTEEFLTEVGCRLYLDVELDVETCHALDFKAYIEQRRILRRERK